MDGELRTLLSGVRGVLFDFDGPLCHLFAPKGAAWVAEQLHEFIAREGLPAVRPERENSPIDVLREAALAWSNLGSLTALEEELARLEQHCAEGATETDGAEGLVRAFVEGGVQIAITTNNSEAAVGVYLERCGLAAPFGPHVYGRQTVSPDGRLLLKPDPGCISRALRALRASEPDRYLMIGDSSADVVAAQRAGVRFLGFENPHVDDNQELRRDFPDLTIVPTLNEIRTAWSRVVEPCGSHSASGDPH